MAGLSDALEIAFLNAYFRNTAYTPLATIYVSLHTADPTDAGTGTEVSGGSYARVACTTGTSGTGAGAVFSAPATNGTAKRVSNDAAVTFAAPTANWGTVTHSATWSAASGGTMGWSGALVTPRAINSGDGAPTFPIGALTYDLD